MNAELARAWVPPSSPARRGDPEPAQGQSGALAHTLPVRARRNARADPNMSDATQQARRDADGTRTSKHRDLMRPSSPRL